MATISRTGSLNNQASNTTLVQKTTPKAPESLYSYALENKSAIAKIALGMFGTIAVAATAYYNYDRLSSLDIWSINDKEPFPKSDVKHDQPGIKVQKPDVTFNKQTIPTEDLNTEINKPTFDPIFTYVPPTHRKVSFNSTYPAFVESLFQGEVRQKNPGYLYTNIAGATFVSPEASGHVEAKTVETEQLTAKTQNSKKDESSEAVKHEEETVFAVPVSNDEDSSDTDSFYDKHYKSLAGLGLVAWAGVVSYIYWKVFKAVKSMENDALLEVLSSKTGIELSSNEPNPLLEPREEAVAGKEDGVESGENKGEKTTGDASANPTNSNGPTEVTPEVTTPDSNPIQTKIMVSTPTKNGSFKDEDLNAAVINVFKTVLDNENVIYTPEFDPKLMIDRIKDLSEGALKLLQKEKNAQQDVIAEQLQVDAKDLQLSLAALSPVKLNTLEPAKEIDSEEFISNDDNVPMKRGASAVRGGRGASRGGRGGRGGAGVGVAQKVVLSDEEKYYANEAKKIQRNWIARANSYSEFTDYTSEAKAQIEHLKVLLAIHEFYKEENSKLGEESPQYILANEHYTKALEELETFKSRSMTSVKEADGVDKFKKFTSMELEILLAIFNIHSQDKKVDPEKDKPDFRKYCKTDEEEVMNANLKKADDKWNGFVALQDEWGATLKASGWFATVIKKRIDNRLLEVNDSKFELEPSEEIPKYVPQEKGLKVSTKKLLPKPSVMTPVDEIKMRHQARLNRSENASDSFGLNPLNSPYKPPVGKPDFKPLVNTEKETSEKDVVDLDDLIKGLEDSQFGEEKNEVKKNPIANLYEDNKTLIERTEKEYFESLRDTLDEGIRELTKQLMAQEGDDFVPTLEEAEKPLNWVKAYLADNQSADPDVIALVKTHRKDVDELIRKALIQHAVKSGKLEDEAAKFATDVMDSKPLSLEELYEQHNITNALTAL